jgi:hypothetical protein
MADIRPIETRYKGYRFRSRLEARWAVFFDALGIQWQYEQQGFELNLDNPGNIAGPPGVTISGKALYLPDFWLPQVNMFAEVKPTWPTLNELALIAALSGHPHPVLILDGPPDARTYWAAEGRGPYGGPWDVWLVEHQIDNTYLREHRFWTGDCHDLTRSCWYKPLHDELPEYAAMHAVHAARAARFEHGETPA